MRYIHCVLAAATVVFCALPAVAYQKRTSNLFSFWAPLSGLLVSCDRDALIALENDWLIARGDVRATIWRFKFQKSSSLPTESFLSEPSDGLIPDDFQLVVLSR